MGGLDEQSPQNLGILGDNLGSNKQTYAVWVKKSENAKWMINKIKWPSLNFSQLPWHMATQTGYITQLEMNISDVNSLV